MIPSLRTLLTLPVILTEDAPQFDAGDAFEPLNIVGSADDDYIEAGMGDDFILGNEGHDFIDGYEGADEIHGGDGDDVLIGGMGADLLYGGTGDDLYVVNFYDQDPNDPAQGGLDVIEDSDGVDTLLVAGWNL